MTGTGSTLSHESTTSPIDAELRTEAADHARPASARGAFGGLRDGRFFIGRRLRQYPLILIGFYIFVSSLSILAVDQILSTNAGLPPGADFIGFWSVSWVELHQKAAEVYNDSIRSAAQTLAMGYPVSPFLWLYPPTAGLLVLPLALLPFFPSMIVWEVGQLAMYVGFFRRVAPHPLTTRLVLAFPGVFVCLLSGQNGLLSATLLGIGLTLLERRPLLAGAFFAALLYKPHLGLLIPVALLAGRRWRALAGGVLAAILYIAATLPLYGLEGWEAFFHDSGKMADRVMETGVLQWGKMASVYAGLRLLGINSTVAWTGQAAVTCAMAVFVVHLWRGPASFHVKAAGLVSGGLLASPFFLDYDLAMLGPAIFWLTEEGRSKGFLPWEITLLALAWLLPLFVRVCGMDMNVPIGPLNVAIIVWLCRQHGSLARAALLPHQGDRIGFSGIAGKLDRLGLR